MERENYCKSESREAKLNSIDSKLLHIIEVLKDIVGSRIFDEGKGQVSGKVKRI